MFLGHPTISWRSRDIVDIFSISDIGAEGLCHCCSTHRYRNIGGRFPASVKSSALHGRPPRPQGGFPHWKIEGNRLKKAIPIYSSVASLTWKKNQIPMFKKDKSSPFVIYKMVYLHQGTRAPKMQFKVWYRCVLRQWHRPSAPISDIEKISMMFWERQDSWNGRASFFSGQTLGRVRCHARGNPPLQLCHDPIGIRY